MHLFLSLVVNHIGENECQEYQNNSASKYEPTAHVSSPFPSWLYGRLLTRTPSQFHLCYSWPQVSSRKRSQMSSEENIITLRVFGHPFESLFKYISIATSCLNLLYVSEHTGHRVSLPSSVHPSGAHFAIFPKNW